MKEKVGRGSLAWSWAGVRLVQTSVVCLATKDEEKNASERRGLESMADAENDRRGTEK